MESTTHPLKDADPLRPEVRVESHALKRCGCATPGEKCPDAPRTVKPDAFNPDTLLVFDVRREADYAASDEIIPGAMWKNPDKIDIWVNALPRTLDVVIYCVRGGGVSNSVVDRLQAEGVKARFIEGGIEAYKAAGGEIVTKEPSTLGALCQFGRPISA